MIRASVARQGGSVERFKDEVRIARQISHRSVCRVHDLGDRDGQVYLSMEWIQGRRCGSYCVGGCAGARPGDCDRRGDRRALDAMTKRSNFWNGRRGWDTRATTSRTIPI